MSRLALLVFTGLLGCSEVTVAAAALAPGSLHAACVVDASGDTVWRFRVRLLGPGADHVRDVRAHLRDRRTGAPLQSYPLFREPGTASWLSEWQERAADCTGGAREAVFVAQEVDGPRDLGVVPVEPADEDG